MCKKQSFLKTIHLMFNGKTPSGGHCITKTLAGNSLSDIFAWHFNPNGLPGNDFDFSYIYLYCFLVALTVFYT